MPARRRRDRARARGRPRLRPPRRRSRSPSSSPPPAGIADRIPLLSAGSRSAALSGVAGVDVDYDRQVEPWAGRRDRARGAARGPPRRARADDRGRRHRRRRASSPPSCSGRSSRRRRRSSGTDISVGRRRRRVGGRGRLPADRVAGRASRRCSRATPASLDGADGTGVIDELPDDRVAYAFVSAEGARALFGLARARADRHLRRRRARPRGPPRRSAPTAPASSSRSAATSIPTAATSAPGFFAALPSFTPTLTSEIGPTALAYLGLGDPAGGRRRPARPGPVELAGARRRLPPPLRRPRQAGGDRHRRRPAAAARLRGGADAAAGRGRRRGGGARGDAGLGDAVREPDRRGRRPRGRAAGAGAAPGPGREGAREARERRAGDLRDDSDRRPSGAVAGGQSGGEPHLRDLGRPARDRDRLARHPAGPLARRRARRIGEVPGRRPRASPSRSR